MIEPTLPKGDVTMSKVKAEESTGGKQIPSVAYPTRTDDRKEILSGSEGVVLMGRGSVHAVAYDRLDQVPNMAGVDSGFLTAWLWKSSGQRPA